MIIKGPSQFKYGVPPGSKGNTKDPGGNMNKAKQNDHHIMSVAPFESKLSFSITPSHDVAYIVLEVQNYFSRYK